MEEDFNNIENVELKNDEKKVNSNKKIFLFIIITISSVIVIIIIIFLYFLLKKDDENNNVSNICKEGKEENCLKCKKNECIKCNPYYELIDGKCKATFSFRATYETIQDNQNIDLIYTNFEKQIIKMIIDENEEIPNKNFTFKKAGIHTVYMLINLTDLTGVNLMFYKVDNLKTIYFSKEFNISNLKYISNMFLYCTKLTSVDITNFNTQNVEYMNDLFHYCSSLTSIDLSNFNTSKVKYMYTMFSGCSSLKHVNLSSFNTKSVTHMSNLFQGCSSLSSIDISNFNTENVISMAAFFEGCSSLTSLNLSNINTSKVQFLHYMFNNCKSLKYLDISNFSDNSSSSFFNFSTSLPPSGKIKVNKHFLERIKEYIPESWEIIYSDD